MKSLFKNTLLLFLFTTAFFFQSCEESNNILRTPLGIGAQEFVPKNLEIQDFIWKGLNTYYLWQADVPNLADDRFASQQELNAFLQGYPAPEDLFDALRVDKSIDRFSWIVDDYLVLEQQLQGTSKNNGVEYGLVYKPNSTTDIFGYVRYIIPNSDASTKDIHRGDIFYAVNGTQLTISNYGSLLGLENYTLNLADYNAGDITPNGKSVELSKTTLAEKN